MNSAKLHAWLQVIGVFGVVAALVFVGLQVRQSQEIALAAQQHARSESIQDYFLTAFEAGFDFSVIAKPIKDLDKAEFNARWALANWLWTTLEDHHFQYQQGFLSDESWQATQKVIPIAWSSEVATRVFKTRRVWLRPSFVRFVEQTVQKPGEPN